MICVKYKKGAGFLLLEFVFVTVLVGVFFSVFGGLQRQWIIESVYGLKMNRLRSQATYHLDAKANIPYQRLRQNLGTEILWESGVRVHITTFFAGEDWSILPSHAIKIVVTAGGRQAKNVSFSTYTFLGR